MGSSIHVLGIIELDSVAQGYLVLDQMVKAAPITIVRISVINPGKFLIMLTGAVAEVEESLKRGITMAAECLLDYLFLPNLHRDVIPALSSDADDAIEMDAIGVIEAFSTTAGIEAADAAAKEAAVRIVSIRVGNEMGGKSSATITGPIGEVEAAITVAGDLLSGKKLLVRTTVIPRPHDDLAPYVARVNADGRN